MVYKYKYLGGSNEETHKAGAAKNAVIRNCNITFGDWYAVCSQMNSTVIIESGTYKINNPLKSQGGLQANFIGKDGPAGFIEIRGCNFTGMIKNNNTTY